MIDVREVPENFPINDLGVHAVALVVLVSEDTDFGELLALQRTVAPSFVLLRTYEPMTPNE